MVGARAIITGVAIFVFAGVVHAGSVQLPRTGQTSCYNASGGLIDCTNTGQDADVKKGVDWPVPRFTDNGNGSVTDNLTSLMWTKDAGTPTVGSCTGSYKTWQGALDYVTCLNTNGYLGYSDWRLPNINELESLMDGSKITPALPSENPFSNVASYKIYWSSSTQSSDTNNAWYARIGNTGSISTCAKTNSYDCCCDNYGYSTNIYAWLVRSSQ